MTDIRRLTKLIAATTMLLASGAWAFAPTAVAQEHLVESCPADTHDALVAWCLYVDANQDTNYTKVPYPSGYQPVILRPCPVNPFCFEVPVIKPTWGELNEPGGSSYGHVRVQDQYVRYTTDVAMDCRGDSLACTFVPWAPVPDSATTDDDILVLP